MTKKALSNWDKTKLQLFRWLPADMRGKMLVNVYLEQLGSGKMNLRKLEEMSEFNQRIMHQPGNVTAMYRYLSGSGKDKIPALVKKHLGDHWYTDLVSKLSGTSLGNNIVLNQVLEKTLPTINGDNSLVRKFFEAGGQV